MQLDISDTSKACIAERGYDVRYGARPLRRALTKEVLNPLSRLVLEGCIQEGEIVKVRTRGEAIKLQKTGEAKFGWIADRPMSEDKNDVVILKNHEAIVIEDNGEDGSKDEVDDWLDDLNA